MARTISVALASYNGAAYLREQLASIAAQTRPPDELVVSDDGSTDGTQGLVRRFAEGAPFPVRLLERDRRLGILDNFYAAFAGATGDLIVYCDQDDVWMADKLARQEAEAARGAVLVAHPSAIVDADLRPAGGAEPFNTRHGLIAAPVDWQAVALYGHQAMFGRAVLDLMVALRGEAERISTLDLTRNFDVWLPFCASLLGPVAVLADPLVRFRRHASATSGAGLSVSDRRPPLGERVRARILHTAAASREALAIAEAADRHGLLDPVQAALVLPALRRKASASARQARVVTNRGIGGKLIAWPASAAAAAAPLGFGNDDRARALKLTCASLIA